ncbi:MAG: hypothetical protein AB7S77_07615 [Desulfatirhabdiaceae bacterium]
MWPKCEGLFGISQFDQGEAFGMVIVQEAIEDQGIGGKVVCAGAVAAKGVGDKNESALSLPVGQVGAAFCGSLTPGDRQT